MGKYVGLYDNEMAVAQVYSSSLHKRVKDPIVYFD